MDEFEGLDELLNAVTHRTPLDIARNELKILEGKIVDDESNLTDLIKQIRVLSEQLTELNKKKSEIENARFRRNAEIRKAKREVEKQELLEEELVRARQLEAERLQTYENIKAKLEANPPEWYGYAKKHQWEAAMAAALNGSTIIADGMGLGKTLEAIMAMDTQDAKKICVIAPNDVAPNFYDDIAMWAPHRNSFPLVGATKQLKEFVTPIIKSADEFTIVMNPETLWGRGQYNTDFINALKHCKFDLLVVDEAHMLKNSKGLSFEVISEIRSHSKNCIPMTGTPILNSPEDMWTMLNLVDPKSFYDKYTYLDAYCTRDLTTGKWTFKSGGEQSLIKSLKGRIIRRTIKDTDIVLPPQYVNEVLIPHTAIPQAQREVMQQINEHAQLVMNKVNPETGEPISMSITAMIALITRQRQASVWPGGIEIKEWDYDEFGEKIPGTERIIYRVSDEVRDSIKMDVAVSRLAKAKEAGRRSVVFSQFKTALVELEQRLLEKGLRVARFDGDTSKPVRQRIKKDFLRPKDGVAKETYEYDVVLANFKTGGVGLTFTEATYMLLLDEEWNPGKNEQAFARINRIGQTEENYVDILRLDAPSIDQWMKTLNEYKKAITDGLEAEIDIQASLTNFITNGEINASGNIRTQERSQDDRGLSRSL